MTEHPRIPDNDLVKLTLQGDKSAFETLIRRHEQRLFRHAMAMMRNRTDAQDVVQEAFMNAYRRLDGFRFDAQFSSWLHRIATNSALMKMRSRRRKPEVPLDLPGGDADESRERPVLDPAASALERVELDELGEQIRRAVDTLPSSYRAVFELADLQHKSMKEVAQDLALTVPNVKTRLHRARLRLRAELAEYLAAQPA